MTGLQYVLTDLQNGTLSPLGINCLRQFKVFGDVVWGARTLQGADQLASQWKYVPIRRMALFLEASLYSGTQWVMVSQVEDHIGVSGTEVQRAILLGAQIGRLHFAGVPAHSIAVRWQPEPMAKPQRRKATKKRGR